MGTRILQILFFVWLAFVLLITAPLAPALSQETIKVGVPGPYSGPAAEKGEHLKYGIQLAAEEINGKGGFLGKKVELVFADTEAKPEVGVSAYEKMVTRDKVQFIVGEVNSDVALATLDVVARYRIPALYVIPASDELGKKVKSNPQKYAMVFMVDIPVSVMQSGSFLWLDEATKSGKLKVKEKTYALIYEDSSWGRIVGETWKNNMEKIGWKNVLTEVTPFKESEYMPILARVKKLNPELVKIEITSLPAGVAITKQIAEMGIKSYVFGGVIIRKQSSSRAWRAPLRKDPSISENPTHPIGTRRYRSAFPKRTRLHPCSLMTASTFWERPSQRPTPLSRRR